MTSKHSISWVDLCVMGAFCLGCMGSVNAADTHALALQTQYEQLANQKADSTRGQQFFNATHGNDLSCAACHGKPPTQPGKHASTGKSIAVLAPALNAERFVDNAKVEKWFRRNCKDVLNRECNALEKADVMAYVRQFK